MNGYADQHLSEENFGPAPSVLKSFDAFPKTKPTYLTRTQNGGAWTLVLIATCSWLAFTEILRWWAGTTTHTFSVEKGISHDLQINLDIVVAMRCQDVHVNVQDASGDRILAGDLLKKDPTQWGAWGNSREVHKLNRAADQGLEGQEDVHDYLGAASGRRKFSKTPKLRGMPDACRVYGSLEGNKVQGDFHITARGHGYMEFGEHLNHNSFNFSHTINELSFGPFYPSLTNPLDSTLATTESHFYKFQYYLSVVPTIYTEALHTLHSTTPPPPGYPSKHTIYTNQYAVTEQSHPVGESQVPGIFVKFDIEPILLTIAEEKGGLLALVVRLVNVVSGVLVAGGWCYQLVGWGGEVWGRRRRRESLGVLHGRGPSLDEKRFE
ncbi:hypothetical protein W97_03226 [Coniosporium apollinis CBS 100218]|uniref:Endoplasmic reticulum-Golgi intermediate compartment protein n=1 Tax=Coniosporium apollinis (strain CBS 100218) TaxID=1168221 RepID=R7YQQ0_CONA1|nr:uncharacterized protein W97_03226 [Coniosporium apollinis CBS 100218]EON63996.1 hypothetical protein W97_03226 [Coniosporium apollinis CBS 100218]